MLKEFKDFIMKGNVLDLAVAVIIAGAFGAIVASLTGDVIMPFVGYVMGGIDFSDLAYVLKPAVMEGDKVLEEGVKIGYGKFIQTIIDFLIIAFVIFMLVRTYNKAEERRKKKEEEAPAAPPEPSAEEKLLAEIRDLLRK